MIPGGESTTISRLITQKGLKEPILKKAKQGTPIFGTCAGMVLLASSGSEEVEKANQSLLGLIDAKVNRNAFGRQRNSFHINIPLKFLDKPYKTVFIRAPAYTEVGEKVDILGKISDKVIAARQKNILVTAFHPELVDDNRIYNYFLEFI
ncbi:MAG: putative glutamine amidotransferase involved in pyridoxine biosynthesis [Candidatus Methanohalarchaeum thermophilum]|uniref:Glutamine amidotransferase involved in pyridoxine biosynthesis n=1 Tax=Methanohalarchaeum thermophilum TaxID=1903181 RepID=A0A1Q6DUY3_METT1|nr:MAG: putative glutamine amidotransferase involved in pyridoxine biosynthesis [Candidatus Methanohalarchaeum thermophilum]